MTESEAQVTAAAEQKPVEPRGGAGLFDIDPDQGGVSQDPNAVVKGDLDVFPENGEV
ncbi:hypothetical protein [Streptomyces acidicola]|uniref:hypothetical protein n=1 Tax=Streptomyces acidicola TaxID=2596892 RepID=UPI00343A99C5